MAETVNGAALSLEGIDYIHRGDGLALGVFAVPKTMRKNKIWAK